MRKMILIGFVTWLFGPSAISAADDNKPGSKPLPSRQQLLQRFDANRDKRLDEGERKKLRDSLMRDSLRTKELRTGELGMRDLARRRDSSNQTFAQSRRALVKQFDKDGDGKLSKSEQSAARQAAQRRSRQMLQRPEVINRFDKNGDGALDARERAAALKATRGRPRGTNADRTAPKQRPNRVDQKSLLSRFDKDGNGVLGVKERAAALAAFQKL